MADTIILLLDDEDDEVQTRLRHDKMQAEHPGSSSSSTATTVTAPSSAQIVPSHSHIPRKRHRPDKGKGHWQDSSTSSTSQRLSPAAKSGIPSSSSAILTSAALSASTSRSAAKVARSHRSAAGSVLIDLTVDSSPVKPVAGRSDPSAVIPLLPSSSSPPPVKSGAAVANSRKLEATSAPSPKRRSLSHRVHEPRVHPGSGVPVVAITASSPAGVPIPVVSDTTTAVPSGPRPPIKAIPQQQPPSAPSAERKLQCAICWDDMHEFSSTPCGHVFCPDCIRGWLKRRSACPTCQKKVTPRSVHRIYLSL